MLHIALRILALHGDLTHVGDIEEADMLADGQMLLCDTHILDGHLEATEGRHEGTQRDVLVEKASTFFLFL